MAKNANFCVWSVVWEHTFSKKSFLQKPRKRRRSLGGSHLRRLPLRQKSAQVYQHGEDQEQPEVRSPPCWVLCPPHDLHQEQGGPAAEAMEGGSRHFFLRAYFARLGITKEKTSSGELGGNCRHPPASLFPSPGWLCFIKQKQ